MNQENNQLKDQANKPLEEKEGLKDTNLSGEAIRKGANEVDQLDKIKQNVSDGGRDAYQEKQAGTPPTTEPSDEQ
ncbi:hypothetical protein [Mucilaginibacter sp. CSA2-8R]|uniref:hypothetical protein n=1 Tax=Mucilaginibacter sp. CSA2-8R TaxID=3141542 RepID=UPI00315E0148